MAQTDERREALRQRVLGALRALRAQVRTTALPGVLAAAALLAWLAALSAPDGRLHVTFFDVGQGEAVLLETPSGRQVVVDGGPSGTAMTAHLGRRMPFWDRALDVVVLTDRGDAHAAGLVPVVERYAVAHFWSPEAGEGAPAAYEALRAALRDQGLDVLAPVAGTRMDLGDDVVLTVLHPADDGGEALVLRVDYGATCFLLAGSADLDVERALLARGADVRCDVVQVGEQGGSGATSPRFLEAVHPALAVISCEEGNGSDPDEAVLARLEAHGATVVRTDEMGSIEVISDGAGYKVRVGR
jgi:competence protein ComEC